MVQRLVIDDRRQYERADVVEQNTNPHFDMATRIAVPDVLEVGSEPDWEHERKAKSTASKGGVVLMA